MDRFLSRLPAIETLLWILASVTALAALVILAPAFLGTPGSAVTPEAAAATATSRPTLTPVPTGTSIPLAPPYAVRTPIPLPSIPAGAQLFTFIADPTQTGWVATGETKTHWGDRNLHAGTFRDQVFQSVLYFDLTQLSPGSQVLFAQVELTGLARDNLGAGGEWAMRLLNPDILNGWGDHNPAELASASIQADIGDKLTPKDLDAGQVNQFTFNPSQLALLEQSINSSGQVALRIDGPASGPDSLFTWDGAGLNLKSGAHPVLKIIAVPSKFVVITNTPTPQNVITAAAQYQALQTRIAKFGTPTPFPRNFATATPVIYVTSQPTPANVQTRIALAQYATAVAQTTGTFTPTPPNWIVVTPVPPTWTPGPTRTPYAISLTTLTPVASGTPKAPDSILFKTPIPNNVPGTNVQFKGNILFFSDRYGGSALLLMRGTSPWDMLTALTGTTLYDLAQVRDEYDPSRMLKVWYPTDPNGVQQVGYVDLQSGWVKQVTNLAHGVAYDAAWSPDGTRIAYVSTETGGDEIYVFDLGSNTTRRVTFSDGLGFPWNKRPSWSPDGSRIAFMSNRNTGHWQIWVVNADGSELQNVSNSSYTDMYPVWVKNQ